MSKQYIELEKRHASEESKVQAENRRAEAAEKEWESLTELGSTGYLQRKKIDKLYGARIGVDTGLHLVIPMRDLNGKLWGLQRISDEKRPDWNDSDKWIDADTKMKGTSFQIGAVKEKLYLCEGFATGASIHMATGEAVLVCFNCWNMRDLAAQVRAKYPSTDLFICADDDKWTTNAKGEPWNPGLQAAHQAGVNARAKVLVPRFKNESTRPTDFNDLHFLEGLAEVRAQLLNVEDAGRGVLETVPEAPAPYLGKQGKPIKMPERLVVERVFEHFRGNMCKQGKDLFVYIGTHWRLVTDGEADIIMTRHIQNAYLGQATGKDLLNAFNYFVRMLPEAPRDMFIPASWCVNFKNGTLYINEKELKFGPHRKEDYLVNCIPYDYDPECLEENGEFNSMLERIFEGDSDKEEKKLALQEMFGSCLLPAFPHLFMLHGRSGSGKSTIIQLAIKMMSPENVCSVEPCDFKNFGMETMAGKLINIDADITISEPIRDAVVKKVVDRMPIRLQRKGKRDLYVPLPPVHIFGGNGIPPTLEGVSRAHDRRWTFIEFNRVFATVQHDFDFVGNVWGAGSQGVLNFAVKGLKRLMGARGKFTQPASGKEVLEEWQLENDAVGSFLKSIKDGEVYSSNQVMKVGEGVQIERPKLYEEFRSWCDAAGVRKHVSRTAFFKQLSGCNTFLTPRVKVVNGVRYLEGIGWVDRSDMLC